MSNTGDPNFAPYPGRYEVARAKGVPPNEELEALADHLFSTRAQWGPSDKGIGGSWDCLTNCVVIVIRRDTDEAARTWINAIEALHDPRIRYETYIPTPRNRRAR